MNKKLIRKLKPFNSNTSIFGFKILNSKLSIIYSYIFILVEYFVVPMFGLLRIQLLAGSSYIILSNISVLILSINSFIQKRTIANPYFVFLTIPLVIYSLIAVKKITFNLTVIYNLIF